ncbi:MAG: YraN family protein [Bacteroidia bacterium]
MAEHNEIGKIGEDIALNYLKRLGYNILEQNWRYKQFELDLLALDGNTLVVVEVKTRKSDTFGTPEVFVDRKKQQFLIRAVNEYVISKSMEHEIRFDIISVIYGYGLQKVEHIKDAFYPVLKR